jgi:hypothetical protein
VFHPSQVTAKVITEHNPFRTGGVLLPLYVCSKEKTIFQVGFFSRYNLLAYLIPRVGWCASWCIIVRARSAIQTDKPAFTTLPYFSENSISGCKLSNVRTSITTSKVMASLFYFLKRTSAVRSSNHDGGFSHSVQSEIIIKNPLAELHRTISPY